MKVLVVVLGIALIGAGARILFAPPTYGGFIGCKDGQPFISGIDMTTAHTKDGMYVINMYVINMDALDCSIAAEK